MMLTSNQKTLIQTEINPLLQLSSEEKKLTSEILRIKQVISQSDPKTNDNERKLLQFLRHPQELFEKCGLKKEKINVGEARKQILEMISQQIQIAAEKANCKIPSDKWQSDTLLTHIQTLSPAQKAFINTIVDGLIELTDNNPRQLSQDIARLKCVFSDVALEKKDDYAILRKPTACFLRLENHGAPITVGEVKNYLIDYISDRIAYSTEKSKAPPSQAWNKFEIKHAWIPAKDFVTQFETLKPRTKPGEPPYSVPRKNTQIYKAWIQTDDNTLMTEINLMVRFNAKETMSKTIPFKLMEDDFDDVKEEDAFLKKLAIEAKPIVEVETINAIMSYLVREKIISYTDANVFSPLSKILLTYKVYFNALLTHKISRSEFNNLTIEEIITLEHKVSRQLFRAGLSNINRLKRLSKNDIEVLEVKQLMNLMIDRKCVADDILSLSVEQKQLLSIPFYNKLVYDNKLAMDELKKLTPKECKNLFMVPSVSLQQKNIVDFKQIKSLSAGAKHIISQQFFFDLLLKRQLRFAQIENFDETEGKLLTSNNMIKFIAEQIIPLHEALCLPLEVALLINNDFLVNYLLEQRWLTLEQLKKMTHDPDQHFPLEKYALKPLEKSQADKFKYALADFCKLSSAHLVYGNDLHFLYKNFEEIQKVTEYGEKPKDEKKLNDIKGSPLLRYEPFKLRCYTNIRQRLQTISKNNLLKVPFNDSLEQLAADCRPFFIDLKTLQKNELLNNLETMYQHIIPHRMYRILIQGVILGLTCYETLQLLFGTRLFAIYEQLPFKIVGNPDTLEFIMEDVETASKCAPIDIRELIRLTFQFFLGKLKQEIDQAFVIDHKDTPAIYRGTHQIITSTEYLLSFDQSESTRYSLCLSAFKEIMTLARITLDRQTPPSNSYLSVGSKRLKINSQFFLSKHTLNGIAGIREFCEKLSSVAGFADTEQKLKLRHSVSFKSEQKV